MLVFFLGGGGAFAECSCLLPTSARCTQNPAPPPPNQLHAHCLPARCIYGAAHGRSGGSAPEHALLPHRLAPQHTPSHTHRELEPLAGAEATEHHIGESMGSLYSPFLLGALKVTSWRQGEGVC